MAFRSVTTLPLTRREMEVADLVRDGLTNREIAERLFLSERTVEGHVAQICSKLGVRSRLQIATWVLEQETREGPPPHLQAVSTPSAPARRRIQLQTWLAVAIVVALAIGGIASVARGLGTAKQFTPLTIVSIASGLGQPSGVVADPDRDAIYIADTTNNAIRVLHVDGTSETLTGKEFGLPLRSPTGLTVDRAGRLFIADTGNHRILVFDRYYMALLAGSGQAGYSGDDGPPEFAQLDSPESVAVDTSGNVYIADTGNNRIREINAATGLIATVAGGGETDPFTGNYLGLYPLTIRLSHPEGVAVRSDGSVVIADTRAHAIYEMPVGSNHSFGPVQRLVGNGTRGYSGDGGPASGARISEPRGLAIDGRGNVLLADSGNNRIRMIDPGGVMSTVAGTGMLGFSGDTGPASAARLAFPSAVTADTNGNVYVADTGNARVRILSRNTKTTATKTAAGTKPTFPAGSYMAQIQARGRLVAFVRNAFPFFAYPKLQSGQVEGFDIDMIRAVARAIFGRDDASVIQFVSPPHDRMMELRAGNVDVADATLINAQNLGQVDISDPYLRSVDLLVVKRGSQIRSLADLAGKTVCVATGTLLPELQAEVRQSQPFAKQVVVALDKCVTALHTGTVDAVYDHSPGALAAYASDPSGSFTTSLLAPRMFGYAVPKGHPEFVQFLNGLIEQLYSDGRWSALARKWLNGYDDTFNVTIK